MNIFNSVKGLHPKRNKFTADTYRNDFTAPLGVNIPCFWAEVPPATRIKVSASALVRLQALIAPVMDNIDYYTHFWKVPYRVLENDLFTQFISGEIEAEDYGALFASAEELAETVIYQINQLTAPYIKTEVYDAIFDDGSLMDFLGYDRDLFPTVKLVDGKLVVDAVGNSTTILNWRGFIVYYMIHLNWYMNENIPYFKDFQTSVETLVKEQSITALADLLIGTAYMFSTTDLLQMLPHAWEKDYFTGALPNVQNGDPVSLSLGGTAPVTVDTLNVQISGRSDSIGVPSLGPLFDWDSQPTSGDAVLVGQSTAVALDQTLLASQNGEYVSKITGELSPSDPTQPKLIGTADLSEASVITINEFRFANALQVFKERQMRFGRRRQEYYKGFFDVEPEDLRLQLPKYLGGGRIPINIADIEQTSATSGSSALGHQAGKATAVAGGYAGFSTFCSEETYIIGISFAMPHITYAKSLSRFRMKTDDIYDYFNPSFEHLGEQAIKAVEIFSGSTQPDKDFGYVPRYSEYRFHSNEMHGQFKNSLAYWTLGRIFSSQPALNAHFAYMQPSAFDRIFAVSGQPNMMVSMMFHVRAIKPVSKWGTPMLLA